MAIMSSLHIISVQTYSHCRSSPMLSCKILTVLSFHCSSALSEVQAFYTLCIYINSANLLFKQSKIGSY